MRHNLAIKNREGIWEHFIVSEKIYLYIMQLETYINFPNDSALLRRYPERFAKAIEIKKEQK